MPWSLNTLRAVDSGLRRTGNQGMFKHGKFISAFIPQSDGSKDIQCCAEGCIIWYALVACKGQSEAMRMLADATIDELAVILMHTGLTEAEVVRLRDANIAEEFDRHLKPYFDNHENDYNAFIACSRRFADWSIAVLKNVIEVKEPLVLEHRFRIDLPSPLQAAV